MVVTSAETEWRTWGLADSVRCDGVLFDLDGVLVDSAPVIEAVWSVWARSQCLSVDHVLPMLPGRRAVEVVLELAPHLDVAAEVAMLAANEAAQGARVKAIPGAQELLKDLEGQRWAIVTSGVPSVARPRIVAAGLPLPEVLVTSADVGRGKPDPEGYRLAAQRLGCAPEACVVLEDAASGTKAGLAAGATVIRIAPAPVADEARPHFWTPDLTRLTARALQSRDELRIELTWRAATSRSPGITREA